MRKIQFKSSKNFFRGKTFGANRINRNIGDLYLGPERSTNKHIYIPDEATRTGIWALGPPGKGKTTAIIGLIKQLIAKMFTVVFIDRHGDGVQDVFSYVSRFPKLAERVILYDPMETEQILTIDLLKMSKKQSKSSKVDFLVAAIARYMGEESTATPRATRWLGNIFDILLSSGSSFYEALYLVDILNNRLRNAIISSANGSHEQIVKQWHWFQKLSVQERGNQLESSLNRIQAFLHNERIALMLGSRKQSLDWDDVVSNNKVVLFDLSQHGCLSDTDGDLLGTLFLHDLISYVRSKKRTDRKPIFIICDEYHKYCSRLTASSHAEDRKHGLRWIIANQLPSQLKDDMYIFNAVRGSVQTKIIFGDLPWAELEEIEKDFFAGQHDLKRIKDEIWQKKIINYLEETRIVDSWADSTSSVESFFSSDGESSFDSTGETSGQVRSTGQYSSVNREPYSSSILFNPALSVSEGDSQGQAEQFSQSSSRSQGRSSSSGSGRAEGKGHSEGGSKVPFLKPVFGKEVSSRQFESLEEQRYKNCVSLKQQPKQCATVKILDAPPICVKIEDVNTSPASEEKVEAFKERMFAAQSCFVSVPEIKKEIKERHQRLLKNVSNGAKQKAPNLKSTSNVK